jgi:hypothetical protein
MSSFEYEQVKIIGMIILRRFELFSHNDLYPDDSLQAFTFGSEILNKCSNVGSVSYVVSYLYYLAVLNVCF